MIEALLLGRQYGYPALKEALEKALNLTLEEFAFCDAPHIPVAVVRNLAEGGYLQRSEPIIFLGETGTGKTHLATGLAVEACRQRKRVRFTTAAEMVNELIEAKNNNELNRVTQRWTRYELIVIDELAVP